MRLSLLEVHLHFAKGTQRARAPWMVPPHPHPLSPSPEYHASNHNDSIAPSSLTQLFTQDSLVSDHF